MVWAPLAHRCLLIKKNLSYSYSRCGFPREFRDIVALTAVRAILVRDFPAKPQWEPFRWRRGSVRSSTGGLGAPTIDHRP